MAYREDAREHSPLDRFWYGPFRPVLEVLGFSVLFVILALVAISVFRQSSRLDCERQTGLCTYQRANILGQRTSTAFSIADVSEVRYVQGTGKQRKSGECLLVFRSGRDFRLPSQAEDDARNQHARLQRFFVIGEEPYLSDVQARSLVAKLGMALFALVVGAMALLSIIPSLPFRVEVFQDRIWLPRQRRSIDVSRARKVAVETSLKDPKLRRVAIVSNGEVEFLSPKFRGGWSTHQVTAGRLGKVLGLPVDLEGRLDEDPPNSKAETPSPITKRLPVVARAKPSRVVILAGAAGALIAFVVVVVTAYESPAEGTLDLDCKGRCRFGTLECLPGGSLSMGLPPGQHTIETWAPDEPTHWKRSDVAIQIGQTRRFVCPPTR